MVVVLFAERQLDEVLRLAGMIARAFAGRTPNGHVALAYDGNGHKDDAYRVIDTTTLTPREVFVRMRQLADVGMTVVTASSGRTERSLATFDAADRILLVADLSVPSIRGLQRTIKLCDSLGIARERTPVVLYDCREDAGVTPTEAANVLPREVFAFLPPGPDGPADHAACAALVDRLLMLA
ncbi:MAG: hypothetical protein U0132_04860 [Gemmatimonadaceae bacterium]